MITQKRLLILFSSGITDFGKTENSLQSVKPAFQSESLIMISTVDHALGRAPVDSVVCL